MEKVDEYVSGYREGFKQGYDDGLIDGRAQGWSDLAHRMWRIVDNAHDPELEREITTILGVRDFG